MQVNPYLFYNGNCEAAFKYYEKVLGAKIEALLTHEQAPESMPVPPDWKKKIMHAKLTIDGEIIMASDAPPGHYHQPQGYSVALRSRTSPMANASSRRWPKAAALTCPTARRSGPRALACASTSSGFPGWSTARRKGCDLDSLSPSFTGRESRREGPLLAQQGMVGTAQARLCLPYAATQLSLTCSADRSPPVRGRAAAIAATSIRRGG